MAPSPTDPSDPTWALALSKCSLCGQEFERSTELKKHMVTDHGASRPYMCVHCCNRYVTQNQLRDHVAAVHEKKRPFRCLIG
ncbi:hypothetical protein I4F81_010534 [Pyropia yezoensis]|uniref:Uncharacterized protein n=1 Tax=Pyropia yezoensis TaxID=2788 RepID=A0ACC3CCZ8_PYRYE|nr:hypothetical protein I4F81_010534 [Neopyropia yezoensis]